MKPSFRSSSAMGPRITDGNPVDPKKKTVKNISVIKVEEKRDDMTFVHNDSTVLYSNTDLKSPKVDMCLISSRNDRQIGLKDDGTLLRSQLGTCNVNEETSYVKDLAQHNKSEVRLIK
jgi:hypothetical protein